MHVYRYIYIYCEHRLKVHFRMMDIWTIDHQLESDKYVHHRETVENIYLLGLLTLYGSIYIYVYIYTYPIYGIEQLTLVFLHDLDSLGEHFRTLWLTMGI